MLGFSPESGRVLQVLMTTVESLVPGKALEVLTQQNALNLTGQHLPPLVAMHGKNKWSHLQTQPIYGVRGCSACYIKRILFIYLLTYLFI